MEYLQLLESIGIGLSASVALIFLLARTIASLVIYKVINEWDARACINGLFKQAILYGTVLITVCLTYLMIRFGVVDDVLLAIKGMYYSLMTLIVAFTVGKLAILIKYAFGEDIDLSDVV